MEKQKVLVVDDGENSETIKKILESEEGLELAERQSHVKLNRAMGILSSMPEKSFFELVEEYKPKENCNKCYGRGYTGIVSVSRNHIVCKCVKKKVLASDV